MLSKTLLIQTSYPCMQQIQALNEHLCVQGTERGLWELPLSLQCTQLLDGLFIFVLQYLMFLQLVNHKYFPGRNASSIVMTTCVNAVGAMKS